MVPILENTVAETVGALGIGLAPGTVGAYVVVDREILLDCVEQKLAEDGPVLCMVTAHRVVRVLAGCTVFVADLGEKFGLADCSMVPGPESHILQVPAVHRNPSKDKTQSFRDTVESGIIKEH